MWQENTEGAPRHFWACGVSAVLGFLAGTFMLLGAASAQTHSASGVISGPTAAASAPMAAASVPAAAPVASAPLAAPGLQKVAVATRVLSPFVLKEGETYLGFSAELWERMALEMGVSTEWKETANVRDLLAAVESGQAQVGIAAISITRARAEKFEFSQPMFESGLQILVPKEPDKGGGLRRFWDFVTSDAMLVVLGLLALFILIPGHIAWFIERGHASTDISRPYFPGIFQAMAWAAGAFVGQQSNHLQTLLGRVMSLFAIISSVIFLTYVQATLTTAMTVEQLKGGIQGPNDLPGKKVGTTTGSTAAAWLKDNNVNPTEFQRITEAYAALESGGLDAVVFDAPVLQYYALREGNAKVEVVGPIFKKENYGIAFPPGSPLRKPVNEALLKMREDGSYEALVNKWFGKR